MSTYNPTPFDEFRALKDELEVGLTADGLLNRESVVKTVVTTMTGKDDARGIPRQQRSRERVVDRVDGARLDGITRSLPVKGRPRDDRGGKRCDEQGRTHDGASFRTHGLVAARARP